MVNSCLPNQKEIRWNVADLHRSENRLWIFLTKKLQRESHTHTIFPRCDDLFLYYNGSNLAITVVGVHTHFHAIKPIWKNTFVAYHVASDMRACDISNRYVLFLTKSELWYGIFQTTKKCFIACVMSLRNWDKIKFFKDV